MHGHFRRGGLGQQGCAQPDKNLAHGQGNHTPDHILAALRAGHQPGGQHAAQKIVDKQRIIRLEHQHAEEGKQQAHGAVAPGRENHGHQPHGTGYRKSGGKGVEQAHAVHAQAQQIDALGPYAEQKEQKRDEQHILAAKGGAGLAAGGHKKAYGKQQGAEKRASRRAPAHGIGGGFVQGLQFDLLFAADALAFAQHQLALLNLVIDRLHRGHHSRAALLGGLAVQGQGGGQGGREQNIDGPA